MKYVLMLKSGLPQILYCLNKPRCFCQTPSPKSLWFVVVVVLLLVVVVFFLFVFFPENKELSPLSYSRSVLGLKLNSQHKNVLFFFSSMSLKKI